MLTRLFEGRPLVVLVRLVIASLIVGFILVWLDLKPIDLLRISQNMMFRVWDMGFGALNEAAQYVLLGAMIVVPVWLLSRLFAPKR